MKCINPTTEEETTCDETPVAALPGMFRAAQVASIGYGVTPVSEREEVIRALRKGLESRQDKIAQLISLEMGKPLTLAVREIARTVEEIEYTLSNMGSWLAPEPCPGGTIYYDPLGVVGVISPWNFPVMLPLRGIVPALAAGNGVICKPSELTPRCGVAISEIVQAALGRWRDVFQIAVGGKELGRHVVQLPLNLIAFTGSTQVGKRIAGEASKHLTRCVLELGGLDAAIVLGNVSLEQVCEPIVRANATNSGQVCNALKRVFVPRALLDPFLAHVAAISRALTIGDPQESPDMGPLVSETQMNRVLSFIDDAKAKGARIVSGGRRLARAGYFVEHTVIADLPEDARCLHEEPFGPILPVIPYDDLEDAIARANGTSFGLTASVWGDTNDACRAVARRLVAGTVSINSHGGGSPGAPWGGAKESGIGRMKTREGLHEFTTIKVIR
jgi:acyl-CoA reductase-like NAD-dependent aldehyde dehydrogenase